MLTYDIVEETLKTTEKVSGRYNSYIAFNKEGPVYIFEYDYFDGKLLVRGYTEAQIDENEIKDYLNIEP